MGFPNQMIQDRTILGIFILGGIQSFTKSPIILPSFVCCLSGLFSLGVCAAIHFFGITGSKLCAYASHVARQGYCIQISLEVIPADVIIGHARLKIRSYNSIRRGRIDTATNIIEPIRRVKLTIFNAREEKIIIIIKKGSLPRRKKVIRRK
jgi:hypothetical protein